MTDFTPQLVRELTNVARAIDSIAGMPAYRDLAEAMFDRMTTIMRSRLLGGTALSTEPEPVDDREPLTVDPVAFMGSSADTVESGGSDTRAPMSAVPKPRKVRRGRLTGIDIDAEVAKHGSVIKAAAALGVSAPYLVAVVKKANPDRPRAAKLHGVDIEPRSQSTVRPRRSESAKTRSISAAAT